MRVGRALGVEPLRLLQLLHRALEVARLQQPHPEQIAVRGHGGVHARQLFQATMAGAGGRRARQTWA